MPPVAKGPLHKLKPDIEDILVGIRCLAQGAIAGDAGPGRVIQFLGLEQGKGYVPV